MFRKFYVPLIVILLITLGAFLLMTYDFEQDREPSSVYQKANISDYNVRFNQTLSEVSVEAEIRLSNNCQHVDSGWIGTPDGYTLSVVERPTDNCSDSSRRNISTAKNVNITDTPPTITINDEPIEWLRINESRTKSHIKEAELHTYDGEVFGSIMVRKPTACHTTDIYQIGTPDGINIRADLVAEKGWCLENNHTELVSYSATLRNNVSNFFLNDRKIPVKELNI